MSTSTQLIASVKTYADRNDLSDALILEFIDVAQRRAQRILRIPPQEQTVVLTLTEDPASDSTVISVPSDLISMIHLRTLETDGDTKLLYNSRADTRSYYAREMNRIHYGEYTRQGDQFILSPTVEDGGRIEIFYYRVLPAVNATYADNAANQAAGIVGGEVSQWFRDQVPELLLYGALSELFSVVGDAPEDLQLFESKFQNQISMMNAEEIRRRTTGGVTTTSFRTNGLI